MSPSISVLKTRPCSLRMTKNDAGKGLSLATFGVSKILLSYGSLPMSTRRFLSTILRTLHFYYLSLASLLFSTRARDRRIIMLLFEKRVTGRAVYQKCNF